VLEFLISELFYYLPHLPCFQIFMAGRKIMNGFLLLLLLCSGWGGLVHVHMVVNLSMKVGCCLCDYATLFMQHCYHNRTTRNSPLSIIQLSDVVKHFCLLCTLHEWSIIFSSLISLDGKPFYVNQSYWIVCS
jgi:hypothetical protein